MEGGNPNQPFSTNEAVALWKRLAAAEGLASGGFRLMAGEAFHQAGFRPVACASPLP